MFIGCIDYINTVSRILFHFSRLFVKKFSKLFRDLFIVMLKVKTGHFSEHSNQLWNISGLSSWSKINDGLIKMYQGEVKINRLLIQRILTVENYYCPSYM